MAKTNVMRLDEAFTAGQLTKGSKFIYLESGKKYVVTGDSYTESGFYRFKARNLKTDEIIIFRPTTDHNKFQIELIGAGIIGGGMEMLKTATNDLQGFIKENRTFLYWFATIFLIDYYIFDGKFKSKLEKVFGDVIDKVTNIVDKNTVEVTAESTTEAKS